MLFDGLGRYILHTRLNFQEGSCQSPGMDLLTIFVLKCPGTDGMCLLFTFWTPVLLYHKQFPDFASVLFHKVALVQGQPDCLIWWTYSGSVVDPMKSLCFVRDADEVQVYFKYVCISCGSDKKKLKIIFSVQNLFNPE